MKRTIFLHGSLKELHPDPIEVESASVAEAVRSLSQFEALQPANGLPYPVRIEGVDSDIQLFAPSDMVEIHIYPRTGGAGGKRGFMQVLIGVALVGVAVFAPGALAFLEPLGITAETVGLMGASMAVGGLIQMLMPQPENNNSDAVENSRYLGSNVNTARIGTPIPVIYGTRKWGGHFLSFDVDAVDVAAETIVGNTFNEFDVQPLGVNDRCLPMPIYAEPVASLLNVPVSGWSGA